MNHRDIRRTRAALWRRVVCATGAIWAACALAQTPGASAPPTQTPAASTQPSSATQPATAPAAVSTSASSPTPGAASAPDALAALEWLRGCWQGTVNQREFREQWLPAAGGMMVGAGQTVMQGRTQDFQYLRLETRADGLYYVATPSGQKEATFRFTGETRDEANDAQIFTFVNVAQEFPERIVYRRGTEGWLYAGIEGTLNGSERKVIYPMRHVSCESGEFIRK